MHSTKKYKITFYIDTIYTLYSIKVNSPNMTLFPKVDSAVSSLYASTV